jgi:hypothetical protein
VRGARSIGTLVDGRDRGVAEDMERARTPIKGTSTPPADGGRRLGPKYRESRDAVGESREAASETLARRGYAQYGRAL